MPRAVDSTAGWSQVRCSTESAGTRLLAMHGKAWVVFSCADEPLVNMLSCDPLIEEAMASLGPFLPCRIEQDHLDDSTCSFKHM